MELKIMMNYNPIIENNKKNYGDNIQNKILPIGLI